LRINYKCGPQPDQSHGLPVFCGKSAFSEVGSAVNLFERFEANEFYWSETVRLRKADKQVRALRLIQFHESAIVSQPLHLPIKVDQYEIPFV
jgi:hypothetical protein